MSPLGPPCPMFWYPALSTVSCGIPTFPPWYPSCHQGFALHSPLAAQQEYQAPSPTTAKEDKQGPGNGFEVVPHLGWLPTHRALFGIESGTRGCVDLSLPTCPHHRIPTHLWVSSVSNDVALTEALKRGRVPVLALSLPSHSVLLVLLCPDPWTVNGASLDSFLNFVDSELRAWNCAWCPAQPQLQKPARGDSGEARGTDTSFR